MHPPAPTPPQVYAIDFDTAKTAIPVLKKKNPAARVICYFSAGSWEDYRWAPQYSTCIP